MAMSLSDFLVDENGSIVKRKPIIDPAPPTDPQTVATGVTQTATGNTNNVVDSLTNLTTNLVSQLGTQTDALTTLVNGQTQTMVQSQQDLLKGFQDAQTQQSAAMGDLVKQLQGTISGQSATGQAAKKPNYARALAANKALNGNGLSSTMLTGSGGVAPTSLTLGLTSLLGA